MEIILYCSHSKKASTIPEQWLLTCGPHTACDEMSGTTSSPAHLDGTSEFQDPQQFAYRQNRSTKDAITTLVHHAQKHLDTPKTWVCILFLDFLSEFNTILPYILLQKLRAMLVNPSLRQVDLGISYRQKIVGEDQQHHFDSNCLHLNIKKTKEMVTDFRKLQHDPLTLSINGEVVERVDSYSYIGVEISNQLDWSLNTKRIQKKCCQRNYFVRKLRKCYVCRTVTNLFYKSTVQ